MTQTFQETSDEPKVLAIVQKFGRKGFGYELFISLRPWQIKASKSKSEYRECGALMGFRSVVATIKSLRASSLNPDFILEIHKNARAQLTLELSTEFN
jgi:hypothetical protein